MYAQTMELPEFQYLTRSFPANKPNKSSDPLATLLPRLVYPDSPQNLVFKEIHFDRPESDPRKRFQLTLAGIPVHNAIISVRKSVNSHSWIVTFPDLEFDGLPPDLLEKSNAKGNSCYVYQAGKWLLPEKFARTAQSPQTEAWLEFATGNGDILFREDWLLQFSDSPDSLIHGCVFKPDPVARLRQNYGGLLRDRSDSNSVVLQSALDTVEMRIHFEDDTFSLQNNRFLLGEFSPPQNRLTRYADKDSFHLSRNHAGFEEVNIFYHLNSFRKYQDSLGYSSLADYPLQIDAHGMSGADQSAFSPLQEILAYGDGNVDDGEDAAVVVHEYGHVLSHSALAFGNSGQERRALEEGICDYLAGSYVKSVSDFNWQDLFKWDGHNEFWPGRTLTSTKIYPDNLVGQMHKDGEIFCSALMNIEMILGRAKTHALVFGSMPYLFPNYKMPNAAQTILETDSVLNGGGNVAIIRQVFQSRGIEPGMVIVPNSETVKEISRWMLESNISQSESWILKKPGNISCSIFISDHNGRVLRSFSGSTGDERVLIPCTGLAAGIYFLRVQHDKGYRVFKVVLLP